MKYYAYILKSLSYGTYYYGSSGNLAERLKVLLVPQTREQIFYHPVFNTGSDIFLVNYSKAMIYKFPISKN